MAFTKKIGNNSLFIIESEMRKTKESDMVYIEERVKNRGWKLMNDKEVYTTKTKGDPVVNVKLMHKK